MFGWVRKGLGMGGGGGIMGVGSRTFSLPFLFLCVGLGADVFFFVLALLGVCRFLWKFDGEKLEVFKWTGKNDYVALCEPEFISFGGG